MATQQLMLGTGASAEDYGTGTSSDPYKGAYASLLAGHGDGNTYVKINCKLKFFVLDHDLQY